MFTKSHLNTFREGGRGNGAGWEPLPPPTVALFNSWTRCYITVTFVVGLRPYCVGFSPVTVTFLIATELNCKYFANFSHSHFWKYSLRLLIYFPRLIYIRWFNTIFIRIDLLLLGIPYLTIITWSLKSHFQRSLFVSKMNPFKYFFDHILPSVQNKSKVWGLKSLHSTLTRVTFAVFLWHSGLFAVAFTSA